MEGSYKYKFHYGRIQVECETDEQADHVFQQMLAEDEKRRVQNRSMLEVAIASVIGKDKSEATLWTGELFWKFMDSLGDAQKRFLSQLVTKGSITRLATDRQTQGPIQEGFC